MMVLLLSWVSIIYFPVRGGWIGAIIGGTISWALLVMEGEYLMAIDPENHNALDHMLDILWLLFGLPPCVVLALIVHVAWRFVCWLVLPAWRFIRRKWVLLDSGIKDQT